MTKRIPGGLFVVVEGIDGAGKTTLVAGLRRLLMQECHLDAVVSKEPTQGRFGAALRATSQTGRLGPADELGLLVADRGEHVELLIAPALADGRVVILDRYYFSNLAYQGAEGLPLSDIWAANAFAPTPDCVLLLDAPVAVGLARIAARGDIANAFETAANLEAVRALFLQVLPAGPVGQIINASQSVDEVLQDAFGCVIAALAARVTQGEGTAVERAEQIRHLLYDAA